MSAAHGNLAPLRTILQGHTKGVSHRWLLDKRDKYGLTPLISAVLLNHTEVVAFLLESGANTELTYNGWTALRAAARMHYAEIIRLLILSGADVLAQELETGRTPPHMIGYTQHLRTGSTTARYEAFRMFSRLGCDLSAMDAAGRSIIDAQTGIEDYKACRDRSDEGLVPRTKELVHDTDEQILNMLMREVDGCMQCADTGEM